MFYVITLLTDEGWCQGSDVTVHPQQIFSMVYGAFQKIEDDKGHVLFGSTYRNLQKAMKLETKELGAPFMTFGQVRNREDHANPKYCRG